MRYLMLLCILMVVSCNNSKGISESSKKDNIAGNYKVTFLTGISDVSDKTITLNFTTDGKVNGNNSCNNYGGDYKVDNNKLSFGMMRSTKMFCQESAEIETIFMRNLTEIDSFEFKEDVLILLQGNTQKIIVKKISKKE